LNYWDTSALIKLYVRESDSRYFINLAKTSSNPLLSSDVTRQEMLCALYRKEVAGDLKVKAASKLFEKFMNDEETGRILIIPNGRDVVIETEKLVKQSYGKNLPIMIRALDAIHVASALFAKATTMIATDRRLRDVALLTGLKVLP
jgi:predicted nucleic acid-binding protein